MNQDRFNQVYSFLTLFLLMMPVSHMAACVWIYIGNLDKDLDEEDRKSWLLFPNNDFLKYKNETREIYEIYWFSFY